MTAEQWNRMKELYAEAFDLPEEQRPAFVARLCGHDAELRTELESLLSSADRAGRFLEPPTLPAPAADNRSYPQPGDRLGHYAILQQIGEGGMGTVYQVIRDDDAFRKLAAVKILKRGMDTDYILQRFENEKQILAHFDHPNIARVLDGGVTPDHRPFFVMEFYSGLPLDRYCRDRRPTLEARIRLFQKVCGAVEYAHQNLIVHRDLKPGNILITEDGEPHLLDFGIAKLLSDERQMTGVGLRLMTPGYASPEQIRGEPVNTATDIYSLGILLYEVLTDSHPFPQRRGGPFTPSGMELDKDPSTPSTQVKTRVTTDEFLPKGVGSVYQWSSFLRGDLDKIVLKAMASNPARRYQTVEQLSADLDRFLAGRPVTAVGDSLVYRITKFARRNRLFFAASVVFVLALAGALAVASYEAAIARRQEALAKQHSAQLRRLAQSLVFDVHDAIQTLPGATPVREQLLTRATEALDSLRASAAGDTNAQIELAEVYRRLGNVHGQPAESNLGKVEESLAEYRKAQELLEHVQASGADVQLPLARIYEDRARVLGALGGSAEARGLFDKAIRLREELAAKHLHDVDARRTLGTARFLAGRLAIDDGNMAAGRDLMRQSLKEYEAALAADASHERTQYDVALCAKTLAAIETQLGNYPAATQYANRALAMDRVRLAANPKDTDTRLDVSFDLSELADVQMTRQDFSGALANCQQAVAIREDLLQHDPTNERFRDRTSYINGKTGLMLMDLGRIAEAEPYIRREVELLRGLASTSNTSAQARLAAAEGDLGAWNCAAGKKAEGRKLLASSIAEIKGLQASKKISFSDALPLERLEKAAAACSSPRAAAK